MESDRKNMIRRMLLIIIVVTSAILTTSIAMIKNLVTAEDNKYNFTYDDNNSVIILDVGESIFLILKDYGDGGYIWQITNYDDNILNIGQCMDGGVLNPEKVGDFGYDKWIITSINKGISTFELKCYRTWEGLENAIYTFQVSIYVI